MAKSSIHICEVKSTSEAHNQRAYPMPHVRAKLSHLNQSWIAESIRDRRAAIERSCKAISGRKLQKNAKVIREAVVNLNANHNIEDLRRLGQRLNQEFGISVFQAYIHRDEGHTDKESGGKWITNHHAHLLLDWQDKSTGKTIKLNKMAMVKMQTVVADELGMERGQEGSKAVRLEAQAYKAEQRRLEAERAAERARAAAADEAEKKSLSAAYGLNKNELEYLQNQHGALNEQELKQQKLKKRLQLLKEKLSNWKKSIAKLSETLQRLNKLLIDRATAQTAKEIAAGRARGRGGFGI